MNSEAVEKKEYIFSDDTGDAKIVVYHLFPGIEIAYISIHMGEFDFSLTEEKYRSQYVGIHCCMEGRIEQEFDNEFFYLMPDDCSIAIQDKPEKRFKLPLKYYHGISVGFNTDIAPQKFSGFIGSDTMDPFNIAKRLCGDGHSVILRSVEPLKQIFMGSYAVADEHRGDYLKIKLLELLFYLSKVDKSQSRYSDISVPRTQVELVKSAAEYIAENLNQKINLKMLTSKFSISETYLQKSFKAVYGMSVASFIRMQKMQQAAQMLIHTDRSVDDIAEEFGYINESKFSAVFKKIMGDSPSVFRKEYSKIKII